METSPGTFILFLFINVYLYSKQKISILKAKKYFPLRLNIFLLKANYISP